MDVLSHDKDHFYIQIQVTAGESTLPAVIAMKLSRSEEANQLSMVQGEPTCEGVSKGSPRSREVGSAWDIGTGAGEGVDIGCLDSRQRRALTHQVEDVVHHLLPVGDWQPLL